MFTADDMKITLELLIAGQFTEKLEARQTQTVRGQYKKDLNLFNCTRRQQTKE
jgi:hypothetical protein